jgi:mannose/cellobiose epimerase-like protein (N-acyl-D-glucosamine 2-epimerase family)
MSALAVEPRSTGPIVANIHSALRRWTFEQALPFWARNGVDRQHGGYLEQLKLDGTDRAVAFKRLRVVCRQIYVFSHAALLEYPHGLALARHGYEFLTSRAWLGPKRGWARLLDRDGRVKDPTPDLYDLAFVLFALGWYYRASRTPEALCWTFRTLDFVNAEMRHPGGVGFVAAKPAAGPRLQNPHMHLLEAALVNLEATGSPEFRDLADEIVELFCARLYDPSTRTLAEYFNEDWTRAPGDAGRITEPGHQFEWAWILAAYQRSTGADMRDYVRGLTEFAEANGVDPVSGITFNVVRDDGFVLDRGSRIWPNTERIQAAVATFELNGRDPRPVFEKTGHLLLSRFLSHAPPGAWLDQIGADGLPVAQTIPASTLYHLFIAFTEMLRIEAALERAFHPMVHEQAALQAQVAAA